MQTEREKWLEKIRRALEELKEGPPAPVGDVRPPSSERSKGK